MGISTPRVEPEGANYTVITRSRELLSFLSKKTLRPVAGGQAIIYKCILKSGGLGFFFLG